MVAAIADGYIVAGNNYDNRMYVYGKGPSATTVTVQNDVIARGSSVLIKGTVTDQSSGAKGTPAIADADMEAWMEYLYMQQAIPANAKGVEVTLDTIDPNSNFVHIGTVTSDMSGMFKKMWTPEVPGEYTVIATFAGSESYGSSYAETAIGVTAAPSAQAPIATPGPTATPPSTVTPTPSPQVTVTPVPPPSSPGVPTTYIVIAVVAIIIVVAAAALALRRRK